MADYRQIHTSIWDDPWYCQLTSDEKVVFIWLFSNRRASVSGVYKFTEFICSRETGLSSEIVSAAIKKLIADNKIFVEGDWVWVKNLRKYNDSKSPNSYKRIHNDLSQLPNNGLKKAYIEYYKHLISPLQAPTNGLLEQEQEQEKEQKEVEEGANDETLQETLQDASASTFEINYPTPYIRIFSQVTGMVAIPGDPARVMDTIDGFMIKNKNNEQAVIDYLKPYWEAWKIQKTKDGRKFSRTNNAWLTDWAVSGDMPGNNKHTRKVYE